MNLSVREIESEFDRFAIKADDVNGHCKGNLAWVACRIDLTGTLTDNRGIFHRTIRSTFVFQKRKERWQIVHEPSSRVSQEVREPDPGLKSP